MRLRMLATLAISLGLLSTTACGGGGGGGGGATGTSSLSGRIVTRNGSTANLGGVEVTFLRTGQTVTSNANGSFGFGSVPTGTIGLQVNDPAVMTTVQTLGNDDPPPATTTATTATTTRSTTATTTTRATTTATSPAATTASRSRSSSPWTAA